MGVLLEQIVSKIIPRALLIFLNNIIQRRERNENIKHPPVVVFTHRFFTSYNVRAAHASEVPHKILSAEPLVPLM